jgi:O-6-methylguanine DNA methyltransferase
MQCRNVLTRIDALRTSELEKTEARQVEQHLTTCRSCHQSAEDVTSFAAAVKSLAATPKRSCLKRVQEELNDGFDVVNTGEERVWVAFSGQGVRMVDWHSRGPEEFEAKYRKKFGRGLRLARLPERYRTQVISAMEGRGPKAPEVDLSGLSAFERTVLQTILRIPRGQVRSYAWVARQVRRPSAARAIGNIMARNPMPLLLPCHRVVPTAGGVGNYGYGPATKRKLLEREGVPVHQLDDLARQHARYVASKTTRIFCLPSCHDAVRIREENRVPLRDMSAARRQGFRPCRRCHPAA